MPTSYLKIACIGCSWTQAINTTNAEKIKEVEGKSYPFLLYQKLKNRYKNVKVYNCGIGGSSTKIHKHVFEYVNKVIKPDIVIHQITDVGRADIFSSSTELGHAFVMKNNTTEKPLNKLSDYKRLKIDYQNAIDPNYYYIEFNYDNWLALPILDGHNLEIEFPWTAINPFAKRQINPVKNTASKDNESIENIYINYFKSKNTLTFQQFKNICLYKNHVERHSLANQLDYIADIDYILNSNKPKKFSFFWLDSSQKIYNLNKSKNKQKAFNGTTIETVFKEQEKDIKKYCQDNYFHLDAYGHDIVSDWIINNLDSTGILKK